MPRVGSEKDGLDGVGEVQSLLNWGAYRPAYRRLRRVRTPAGEGETATAPAAAVQALAVWARAKLGRIDDDVAIQLSESAAASGDPTARTVAGALWFNLEQPLLALEELNEALAVAPEDPTVRGSLGAVLAQSGRAADAAAHFRWVLEHGSIPSPSHRICAARCFRRARDRDGTRCLRKHASLLERAGWRALAVRWVLWLAWFSLLIVSVFEPTLVGAAIGGTLAVVLGVQATLVRWSLTRLLLPGLLTASLLSIVGAVGHREVVAVFPFIVVAAIFGGLDAARLGRMGRRSPKGHPIGPWPYPTSPPLFAADPTGKDIPVTMPRWLKAQLALGVGVLVALLIASTVVALSRPG